MSGKDWVLHKNTQAARRARWSRGGEERPTLAALDAIAEEKAQVEREIADDLASSHLLRQMEELLSQWD
ncbi:hypothetical protein [Gordonia sp. (in: high G+C Gram-positive bacteria)]|uniref:hypothetical protein n=1 Tax=Gordonia sp. (in: high G+C Gram-positive bacteria) TaxID=84139 RepID=UPI003F96D2EA